MKGFALWNSEMACNQSIRNNGENTRIIYFFFLFFFFFDKLIPPKKKHGKSSWMEAIIL